MIWWNKSTKKYEKKKNLHRENYFTKTWIVELLLIPEWINKLRKLIIKKASSKSVKPIKSCDILKKKLYESDPILVHLVRISLWISKEFSFQSLLRIFFCSITYDRIRLMPIKNTLTSYFCQNIFYVYKIYIHSIKWNVKNRINMWNVNE